MPAPVMNHFLAADAPITGVRRWLQSLLDLYPTPGWGSSSPKPSGSHFSFWADVAILESR
jgi:hypothetical protein